MISLLKTDPGLWDKDILDGAKLLLNILVQMAAYQENWSAKAVQKCLFKICHKKMLSLFVPERKINHRDHKNPITAW